MSSPPSKSVLNDSVRDMKRADRELVMAHTRKGRICMPYMYALYADRNGRARHGAHTQGPRTSDLAYPIPYTLYPVPYTLYPKACTLYPVPYTLYPVPYTLYPIPYTLQRPERNIQRGLCVVAMRDQMVARMAPLASPRLLWRLGQTMSVSFASAPITAAGTVAPRIH